MARTKCGYGAWKRIARLNVEQFHRDPLTGKERARLDGHEGTVTSLAFAPNGKTIASGSVDGTELIWDLEQNGKH
jgi:WD40 repeat protein